MTGQGYCKVNANIRGGMGSFQFFRNYGSWIYADPEIIPIDPRLLGGGLTPGLILHSCVKTQISGVPGRERSSGVPISGHFLCLLSIPKA